MVPSLRDKLTSLSNKVGELQVNRARILEADKTAKVELLDNLYTQAYGSNDGIRGVVRRAMGNPQEIDRLVAIASKDRVAREGLKSAVLDDLMTTNQNRMEMFTQNKDAITKIFGDEHTKSLEALVEASQRMKDNPFFARLNVNTINKSKVEEVTGTKASTSLGEMRNQVMTNARVFINHLSRFFQATADKSEAAEVQRFLLNPQAVKDTAQLLSEIEKRGLNERAVSFLMKLATNSASSALFGGMIGGVVGAQTEGVPANTTTIDPALLEGFGQ